MWVGSSFAAMSETTLDLRGLRCPLPALKTRKALTRLAAGDRLVIECTDPLSTLDIPNLIPGAPWQPAIERRFSPTPELS